MSDYTTEKKVAGAFIIGGLVGAGISLLYAPQSGRRTRRDIVRFARNTADEAKDAIEDATKSIHDLMDNVSDKLTHLASSRTDIAEGAKKKIVYALDNVQKVVEKQKARFG
ncbi:MAG: YtxH domain-containing protein [Nitrospirae bacterium]|nr:YtxH domain-containing protein [Nitrospirota bacterium]